MAAAIKELNVHVLDLQTNFFQGLSSAACSLLLYTEKGRMPTSMQQTVHMCAQTKAALFRY